MNENSNKVADKKDAGRKNKDSRDGLLMKLIELLGYLTLTESLIGRLYGSGDATNAVYK